MKIQPEHAAHITAAELRATLDYNQTTGVFTWKVGMRRGMVGKVAGHVSQNGYRYIGFQKKDYLAHRLAVFWMTGAWPMYEIDHRDGIRDNNAWLNLRKTTTQKNAHNIGGPRRNNRTGFLGVIPLRGKFQARIKINGVRVDLGYFPTPELAHTAYLNAKNELHPTHLRLRQAIPNLNN